MSLDPDPKTRIPSNFWIEVLPVLDLVSEVLPDIYQQLTRDGVTQKLVDKYRNKKIKSVIHFRKVIEAYGRAEGQDRTVVVRRIRAYILDPDLETRDAFDEFVLNAKRIQDAIEISNRYLTDIRKLKLQFASDYKEDLLASLVDIRDYLEYVLDRLKGVEAPPETSQKEEELDRR